MTPLWLKFPAIIALHWRRQPHTTQYVTEHNSWWSTTFAKPLTIFLNVQFFWANKKEEPHKGKRLFFFMRCTAVNDVRVSCSQLLTDFPTIARFYDGHIFFMRLAVVCDSFVVHGHVCAVLTSFGFRHIKRLQATLLFNGALHT